MIPKPATPSTGTRKSVTVTPLQVEGEDAGKTCSICSTALCGGERMVSCPQCKLPFHQECWKEIGGCGTYGCPAAPDVPKTEMKPADDFQPGWMTEKTCPACGRKIYANALKCKFCRADFPTEKPMTPAEYSDREYTDTELPAARSKVIANFFLSALGFLFFLSIPSNLIHHFTDQGMFRVVRLPASLKVLFYAGCAVSVFWAVIALFFIAVSRF